jgi:hypothetical protein
VAAGQGMAIGSWGPSAGGLLASKRKRRTHVRRLLDFGAGNETRTRDPNLGKVVLYQLSYSREIVR